MELAPSAPYTFLTVVFPPELPLLYVQARSLARYVTSTDVAEIILVVNDSRPADEAMRAALLPQYGPHASKVRVIERSDLCEIHRASGWDSQQILKLLSSSLVNTARYIVLDAKTHLVAPLKRAFLEAPDGRALINGVDYRTNALRYAMERAGKFFPSLPDDYLEYGLDSVTPFIFYTEHVKSLIDELEKRYRRPFAAAFLAGGFTEFTLYSAWICNIGHKLSELYQFHQVFSPTIWGSSGDPAYCQSKVSESQNSISPFFSVHRRAVAQMSDHSMAIVGGFWADRGLASDRLEAEQLLRWCQALVTRTSWRERVQARFLKVVYLSRRVRERLGFPLRQRRRAHASSRI